MRLPLLLLSSVVLSASPALAESPGERPRPFEGFAGVPGEWTAVLNGYVIATVVVFWRVVGRGAKAG